MKIESISQQGIHYQNDAGAHKLAALESYSLPDNAYDISWDAENEQIHFWQPADTDDGDPTETIDPLPLSDLEADIATHESNPAPPPLRVQLRAIVDGFSPDVKARLPFERMQYWMERGDLATMKAVVENADVSNETQSVKDAKQAILDRLA